MADMPVRWHRIGFSVGSKKNKTTRRLTDDGRPSCDQDPLSLRDLGGRPSVEVESLFERTKTKGQFSNSKEKGGAKRKTRLESDES